MEYKIKYGNQHIDLRVPENIEPITVNPPQSIPDKKVFLEELSALLKPGLVSAGIVVSDKTRICGYDKYLPWLIEALKSKGLDEYSIKFYIAYGTHPRQTDLESLRMYGNIYNNYEFIHHDCDDNDIMINIGTTSRGTEVEIRKDILEHDLLILFGSVLHHYFAGYGGGRKLLFPGLAARRAIYSNHKLFIDFDNRTLQPGCRSGKLKDNPVAEDLCEVDKMMPHKILISGIPDAGGKIRKLMTGSSYEDFLSACKIYDSHYRKEGNIRYDNVIAGSGGYPKDINFIQTHKSLHNAASFVRDGGNLFLLGECIDGVGNKEFLNIFKGSKRDIYFNLGKQYSGNGGTALSLLSKTDRIKVYMTTNLDTRVCNTLNIKKLTPEDMNYETSRLKGDSAIIENASIVYC